MLCIKPKFWVCVVCAAYSDKWVGRLYAGEPNEKRKRGDYSLFMAAEGGGVV